MSARVRGWLNDHPSAAFWLIVLLSFLVLVVQAWQAKTARNLATSNRALIHRISEDKASIVQLERANRDSCANYEILKSAVNAFHGQVRSLLRAAVHTDLVRAKHIHNPKLKAADRTEAKRLQTILDKTHLVGATCLQKQGR